MNYPGKPVKQGAKNETVKAIQQQLNASGFGPVKEDGNFGQGTFSAVEELQAAHKLQVDGIVGNDTWNALFQQGRHIINRDHFFQTIKSGLFNGKLTQKQLNGITAILDEWETNYSGMDDRFLAYMLATTFHETATTMQPIEEYGRGAGRPYGKVDPITGQAYYGRGFVQLTWKDNYAKFSTILNADLVNNPALALDLVNATKILFIGMIRGSFTNKKLSDYFAGTNSDWENARKIINGLDRAGLIAGYGRTFYSSISYIAA